MNYYLEISDGSIYLVEFWLYCKVETAFILEIQYFLKVNLYFYYLKFRLHLTIETIEKWNWCPGSYCLPQGRESMLVLVLPRRRQWWWTKQKFYWKQRASWWTQLGLGTPSSFQVRALLSHKMVPKRVSYSLIDKFKGLKLCPISGAERVMEIYLFF